MKSLGDSIEEVTNNNLKVYFDCSSSTEEQNTALGRIVEFLKSEQLKFYQLIDLLEFSLTSEDYKVRSKGLGVFNHALNALGESKISFQVEPVKNFLLSCINDQTAFPECLEGLNNLLEHYELENPSKDSIDIVEVVFLDEKIYIQAFPQTVRGLSFKLFLKILDRYASYVFHISENLIEGFIRAMNGEKDPNNLKLCFTILIRIVLTFPVYKKYEEELYEITSCYFPITYTGKSADSVTVKKTDLTVGLRATMVTSQRFWIPFLISKLLSPLVETKLEVLNSLEFALTDKSTRGGNSTLWSLEHILPFLNDILNTLLKELLFTTDSSVTKQILHLITTIVEFLCNSIQSDSQLVNILKPLLSPCLLYLRNDSDKNLYLIAINVLKSIIDGSSTAASLVIALSFPILEKTVNESTNTQEKIDALNSLFIFSKATTPYKSDISCQINNTRSDKVENPSSDPNWKTIEKACPKATSTHVLAPYNDFIWSLALSYCQMDSSVKELTCALDGLVILAELDDGRLFGAGKLTLGVKRVVEILLNRQHSDETCICALSTLLKMAFLHPDIAIEHGISVIFEKLLKMMETQDDLANDLDVQNLFYYLYVLCNPSKIDLNCKNSLVIDCIQDYFVEILSTKFSYLDQLVVVVSSLVDSISSISLFSKIILIILSNYTKCSTSVLNVIRTWLPKMAINLILRLDLDGQLELLNFSYSLFMLKKSPSPSFTQDIMENVVSWSSTDFSTRYDAEYIFVPTFSIIFGSIQLHKFDDEQKRLIGPIIPNCIKTIFEFISAASESFVVNTDPFFDNLLELNSESDLLCATLGSLVNKVEMDESFLANDIVIPLEKQIEARIFLDSAVDSATSKNIKTLIWITKALIQMGSQMGEGLLNRLLEVLLSESVYATTVASFYYLIFCDLPIVMPRCIDDYKGCAWAQSFSPLIESFQDTFKSNHLKKRATMLMAISKLTKYLPRKELLDSSKDILPLLFHSLESEELCLKSNILDAFYLIISNNPSSIVDRVSSIIEMLLEIANNSHGTSMADRIKAIECLECLLSLSYTTLYPLQGVIIEKLTGALDDPKRLVRKKAVKCRNQWYILDRER